MLKIIATVPAICTVLLYVPTQNPAPAGEAATRPEGNSANASQPAKKRNTALVPVSRENEAWWVERFKATKELASKGNVDVVFIGDSITQGWEGEGAAVWKKYYEPRKALNIGFSGDRTQHVLWRLDRGNLDGVKPKVAVIMIGTNNSNGSDNTAPEIAGGILAIVNRLQERMPKTKILLLGVFPRGEKPNAQRTKIDKVNATIQVVEDNKSVYYLDIGRSFLAADGSLPKEIMPDFLHLSAKGYEIWAEAIEKKLAQILGS